MLDLPDELILKIAESIATYKDYVRLKNTSQETRRILSDPSLLKQWQHEEIDNPNHIYIQRIMTYIKNLFGWQPLYVSSRMPLFLDVPNGISVLQFSIGKTGQYIAEVSFVYGRLHGTFKIFNAISKKLIFDLSFSNDKLNGTSYFFGKESGKLLQEKVYHDDVLIETRKNPIQPQ